jgi:hypothetical protein
VRNGLRRTMRFVSAIAAVLGLLFILSGLLPFLSLGHTAGGASTASAPQSPAVQSAQHSPVTASQGTTPNIAGTHILQPTRTGQNDNQAAGTSPSTRTPAPQQTAPVTPAPSPLQSIGGPVLPPFLDLGTIEGRLSLGLVLALLGMIGLLMTRRRYRQVRY